MSDESCKNLTLLDRLKLYPDLELNAIIESRKNELQDLIALIKNNQGSSGKNLEKLARLLLESPYLKLNKERRRCETGEIDLDFTVKRFEATLFYEFSYLLIVECKDWKGKVGAPEMRTFCSKMRDVDALVGCFFAMNGITRDARDVIRNYWIRDRLVVIVFTGKEIEEIIGGKANLYELLTNKYLAVRSTSK